MKVRDLLTKNSFVIHLPRDEERIKRMRESFEKYNIPMPVISSAVDARSPEVAPRIDRLLSSHHTVMEFKTEVACAMSHVALLTFALNNNLEYITVFEDDVTIGPFADRLLNVELPPDWDVLYLGHCPNHVSRNPASICPPYSRRVIDNWVHFTSSNDSAFGMYGYCIHRNVLKSILDSYTFQCALDYHLLRNHGTLRAFGLYPCLLIHDYNFGSYSNPMRTETYDWHVIIDNGWPLFACSLLHSVLSIIDPKIAGISLCMIFLSALQGWDRKKEMEELKRSIRNFPGLHGCDSYAPFVDLWSKSEEVEAMSDLKGLPWSSGVFVWGHTLLGLVRDGRPIPWERQYIVAKPRHLAISASSWIQFVDYDMNGPWMMLPTHKTLTFNTIVKDGIGYPENAEQHLKELYGADCLDVVRSPSHVGSWGVPKEFRAELAYSIFR